jgi:hypothetical protein
MLKSFWEMSQKSLKIKKTLNNKTKYFQFLCLKEGCYECVLFVLAIKSKTMITNEMWKRLTVSNANQKSTSRTNTKELLSQIDRSTSVMLIASLKFLLTIKIKQSLSNILISKEAECSKKVIAQIERNMMINTHIGVLPL